MPGEWYDEPGSAVLLIDLRERTVALAATLWTTEKKNRFNAVNQ